MTRKRIYLCFIFALVFAFSLCFIIQANAYIGGYPVYTYSYWTLYNYPLGIQNTYGFSGQYGLYGLYGGTYPWSGLYGGAYPWSGQYGIGAWGLYGGAYPPWGLYGGLYGGLYRPGWW